MINQDRLYMQEALKEARVAFENDDVPIGAVIEYKGRIIARAHNQVELLGDPTAHAEMLAITQATNFLKNKWLSACCVYVTIEPCSMCAGAFVLARVKKICFGASDPKAGACGSLINIVNNKQLNHRIIIKKGILRQDCSQLLQDFFRKKRLKEIAVNN